MPRTSSNSPEAITHRTDARGVLRALEEMADELQPGDALPTQIELSRRFNASDRAVRWALDELRREGRIVSRRRVGTVIAEKKSTANSDSLNGSGTNAGAPDVTVDNRTIFAISVPGQAILSRALDLLYQQTRMAELPVICRLFDPEGAAPLPSAHPLGYILIARELFPLAEKLQEAGQRVVVVGTPVPGVEPQVACAYNDQEHGGYLVARHLIELGHRHIAFRGAPQNLQTRRWRGHSEALWEAKKQGLHITESRIFDDLYDQWRRNPELAADYFRRPDAPTAIIAWNDQAAMSLLSLLSYGGIRVPHDVSLIGYDNLPESEQVHPPLTTIEVGMEHQLRAAVRMLTEASGLVPLQRVVVPSTLVLRESTAPPPLKE